MAEIEMELSNLTDRELLVRLYREFRDMNGRCRDHNEALYGNEEHQQVGLKTMVLDHQGYIDRARTVTKLVVGALTVFGIGNIIFIIRWIVGG